MVIETALAAEGLVKAYGDLRAVDGVDLNIRRGEIYCFLGRNGAGKTTTIRMALGLIRPTAGMVTILGRKIIPGEQEVFSQVGFLVETATSYPNLTVQENLDISRRLTGAPRDSVADSINLLGLEAHANRPAGLLSLGNKQRLALARAMLNNPPILILDEPINGLDPAGIIEIRNLLRRLVDEKGVTVFLSSHILSEVWRLADRVGIIHEGRLLEDLTMEELRQKARRRLDIAVSDIDRAKAVLSERCDVRQMEVVEGGLHLSDGLDRIAIISRTLVEEGLDLTKLNVVEEDLEKLFLRLTGEEA